MMARSSSWERGKVVAEVDWDLVVRRRGVAPAEQW